MFHVFTALIKQLNTDGHITAEEASKLISKKLFKAPAPPTLSAITLNIAKTNNSNIIDTLHSGITSMASTTNCNNVMHCSNFTTADHKDCYTVPNTKSTVQSNAYGCTNSSMSFSQKDEVKSEPFVEITTTNTVAIALPSSPHSSLACDLEEKVNGMMASNGTMQSSFTGSELQPSSVHVQQDIDVNDSGAAKMVITEDVDKNAIQPTSSTTSCSLSEGNTNSNDVT